MNLNILIYIYIYIYTLHLSIYSCGPTTYLTNIPPASMCNVEVRPASIQVFPTLRTIGINPLNAELNPICHLLALLEAHHIFHVSGLRVKTRYTTCDILKHLRSLFLHFICYTDHSTSSKIVNFESLYWTAPYCQCFTSRPSLF